MKRKLLYLFSIVFLCIGVFYFEKHHRFGLYFNIEHEIPTINQERSTSYKKVLHIGDSVTAGHIFEYPLTSFWGNVDTLCSYPSYLRMMEGWESTNSGKSGTSPKSWYNKKRDLYDFSNYDLFIIEFGYNAIIVPNHKNQEYDYYCKILDEIQISQPNTTIVLMISPYLDAIHSENADTIIGLSNKYKTSLIDLRETDLMNKKYHGSPFFLNRNKVHMTAYGYYHKAELIRDFLIKSI